MTTLEQLFILCLAAPKPRTTQYATCLLTCLGGLLRNNFRHFKRRPLRSLQLGHIARDTNLIPAAKYMHNVLRFHPKTTVNNIAKIVNVHPETARRHLRQLKEHDWMYTFRREGRSDNLHVPWMPLDVEVVLAQYVEWLADNVANRGERLCHAYADWARSKRRTG